MVDLSFLAPAQPTALALLPIPAGPALSATIAAALLGVAALIFGVNSVNNRRKAQSHEPVT